MNKLEFRAWHKHLKKYFEVAGFHFDLSVVLLYDKNKETFGEDFDEVIIEQYTGLKDKNGKKIYEGDILDFTYQFGKYPPEKYCGVVEFGNPNGFYDWGWGIRFIGKEKPSNTDTLLWIEMPDVECLVIGNIHENPELLRKEVAK